MFSNINEKLYQFYTFYDSDSSFENKFPLNKRNFYESKLLGKNNHIYNQLSEFFDFYNNDSRVHTLNRTLFDKYQQYNNFDTLQIISFSDLFSSAFLTFRNIQNKEETNLNTLPIKEKQEILTEMFKQQNYFGVCDKKEQFYNKDICSLMKLENRLEIERFFYHPLNWKDFIFLFEVFYFKNLVDEQDLPNYFSGVMESVRLKRFNYKVYKKQYKHLKRQVCADAAKKIFTRTNDLNYSIIRNNKL